MALFSERASMLEVQNRALIKSAGERTQRISKLECELDVLERDGAQIIRNFLSCDEIKIFQDVATSVYQKSRCWRRTTSDWGGLGFPWLSDFGCTINLAEMIERRASLSLGPVI